MTSKHTHFVLVVLTILAVVLSIASLSISMRNEKQAELAPVQTTAPVQVVPQALQGDAIRTYLLQNPAVIYEALQHYQQQQQDVQDQRVLSNAVENQDAFLKAPLSPVLGNSEGDLSIVEFFDFNCGYCKKAHATMQQLLKENGNIRLVHKNIPILGPASLTAAKAALASQKQGKYQAFSDAMLDFNGHLTDEDVQAVAVKTGLDWAKLQKDMQDPAIMQELEANMKLAQQIEMTGTPAFIVGGKKIIRGNISLEQWKTEIADVMTTGKTAAPVASGEEADHAAPTAAPDAHEKPATEAPVSDDNHEKHE